LTEAGEQQELEFPEFSEPYKKGLTIPQEQGFTSFCHYRQVTPSAPTDCILQITPYRLY
jgi:hypothetical protein